MHGGARAEKQRLRQEARQISAGLSPEYRREASRVITRQVLALPFWKQAKTVLAYWSLPGEPDPRELMETALREGKTLLLPRCLEGGKMAALPVKDPDGLKPGPLGIPEPEMPADGGKAPEPDLILVPCMAASPGGIRLGHGLPLFPGPAAGGPAGGGNGYPRGSRHLGLKSPGIDGGFFLR